MKRLFFVATLLILGAYPSMGKVAAASLHQVVGWSEVICVAKVTKVQEVDGLKIAEATVSRVIKGPGALKVVYFLAMPTWNCDTSEAKVDEEVVLFLTKPSNRKVVIDSLLPKGAYDEDLSAEVFEAKYGKEIPESATNNGPIYLIEHFGRGRVEVSVQGETKVVDVFDDFLLPVNIERRQSQHEYSRLYQCVGFDAFLDLITAILKHPQPAKDTYAEEWANEPK